jgi:hypothetical protein
MTDGGSIITTFGGGASDKKSFINHVFSTTEEGKAELFNVIQYSTLGVVPIVILNRVIQRFIPDADPEKSSLELLVEIFIQLIIMFCGVVLIHRTITFVPTYSGFNYESLALTHVILAFLIIILSVQTKMGIKVNYLVDRLSELWNGASTPDYKARAKSQIRSSGSMLAHQPSQADYLDNSAVQSGVFPPAAAPTSTHNSNGTYDQMIRGNPANEMMGPVAANGVLGSSFGSF